MLLSVLFSFVQEALKKIHPASPSLLLLLALFTGCRCWSNIKEQASASAQPSDTIIYVKGDSIVQCNNRVYDISLLFPFKRIPQGNKTLIVTSQRMLPSTLHSRQVFGEDTVILLGNNRMRYQNENIRIGKNTSVGGRYIFSVFVDSLLEEMSRTRLEAMYFHQMQQKLSEPSTLSAITDFTYVLRGIQKKPFVLNANVQTPIALGGYRWNIRNTGILSALHVTPQFRVRIFQNDSAIGDNSLPVRTPSYLPGLTLFLTHKTIYNRHRRTNHFAGLKGFHHSNGQDGAEFLGNKVNLYNGNFGEDWVWEILYGGFHRGPLRQNQIDEPSRAKSRWQMFATQFKQKIVAWRVSYEWHPSAFTNTAFAVYNLYGRHRVNARADILFVKHYNTYLFSSRSGEYVKIDSAANREQWRLSLNMSLIADPRYSIGNQLVQRTARPTDRINLYLTLYKPLNSNEYAALFIEGGYYGSDPYNIYFQHRMWFARIGLAFGFFEGIHPTKPYASKTDFYSR